MSLLCILLSKTSIHTETGKKWSWHGGKCARKSDNLASHGNMYQHCIALIDPNSIQETSIFIVVCLSSRGQTWPSINLGFLQGGIMVLLIRPSFDQLNASRSHRNLVQGYCLLIWKHLLRSCHSPGDRWTGAVVKCLRQVVILCKHCRANIWAFPQQFRCPHISESSCCWISDFRH